MLLLYRNTSPPRPVASRPEMAKSKNGCGAEAWAPFLPEGDELEPPPLRDGDKLSQYHACMMRDSRGNGRWGRTHDVEPEPEPEPEPDPPPELEPLPLPEVPVGDGRAAVGRSTNLVSNRDFFPLMTDANDGIDVGREVAGMAKHIQTVTWARVRHVAA